MSTRRNKIQRSRFFLVILFPFLLAACANTPANTDSNFPENSPVIVNPTAAIKTSTPEPTETPTATPSPTGFPDPAAFDWVQVAEGFIRPLLLTTAGDGSNRLFIVEQDGAVRVIENGATLATAFLDINEEVSSDGNEQGLLGLAFHPDYENNGFFYVNYTDNSGNTVISRFQVSSDPNVADPASEVQLLTVDQPYENHNGGNLVFGPDGYLYAGLGDGGAGGDPHGNGQNMATLLGKMLRIDVNAGELYGIPAGNPYVNGGGQPEIWASGLRNPWRFSFDRVTGDLYIADVGQGQWEEINFLPGGIVGGSNFGWNYFEGTHAYLGNPPSEITFIAPITEYDHSGRCSVTGGYVYRGVMLPAWQGIYLYGDYCSGEVMGIFQHSDGAWENQILFTTGHLITSFGEDETGELYLVDRRGFIYQLQAK